MSRLFNFFKKTPDDTFIEKVQLKEEPTVIRSFTDKLGNYAKIKTAGGVELWRFKSNDVEIDVPVADFKTVKKFINYIKEEIEKV